MSGVIQLLRGSYLKSAGSLALGNVLAQVVTLVCIVVLVRIYSAEDFGVLALIVSLSTILSVVASGRYEFAVMNPTGDEESAEIIVSSILLSAVVCVLIFFVVFGIVRLSDLSPTNESTPYLLVPIIALLSSWHSIGQKWCNRMHDYLAMSIARVVVALVGNGGAIVLSLLASSAGATGLVVSYAAGQIVGIVVLFASSGGHLFQHLGRFERKRFYGVLRSYWRFPVFTLPHSLAGTAIPQVPVLFLTGFYGAEATGVFSLVQRVLNQPVSLLASNVGSVFHRRIVGGSNSKHGTFLPEFNAILLMMGCSAILMSTVIVFFGEALFLLVLGGQFIGAALFAQILLPATAMRMLAVPVANVFMVFERQREMLYLQFLHLVLIVAAWVMGGPRVDVESVLAFHATASFIAYGLIIVSARKIVAN